MEEARGRQPAKDTAEIDCPTCGKSFRPYRVWQRACSRKCRDALGPVPETERTNEVRFTCEKCGTDTVRHSTIAGGRFKFCLECTKKAETERRLRKQESAKAHPLRGNRQRARNLMVNYGLTIEQADAMVAAQGNLCAICGEPPKPDGVRSASRLHIDHDHESGRVRGLLCNHCNRGIGAFRDRPELLELAILYLRSFE